MNFYTKYCDFNKYGFPIYQKSEHSFDFEPWPDSDFSLMLGTSYMSLEVNLTNGRVLHLSGFNSTNTWKKNKLNIPDFKIGSLFVEKSEHFLPGMGIEIDFELITVYDKQSGWIRIGSDYKSDTCQYIMFANNTIAAIDNMKIVTIWIKPIFL